MTLIKEESEKRGIFRRIRKQRLKYIAILPSLVTMLNGIGGFLAIIFAAKGQFLISGYIILLAMVADMLDGRLARMSHTTSSFGGQLDSLCDMISFGAAPAVLMLQVMEVGLAGYAESSSMIENLYEQFVWLCAASYLSCAAIRLARFNVENEESEAAHMSFVGLPSPGAAGVVVSLVIFRYAMLGKIFSKGSWWYQFSDNAILYCLPFVVLIAGILMVSRIRYPHVFNKYLKGKKPLAYLMMWLAAIWVVILMKQAVLLVCFWGFAGYGLFRWVYGLWFGHKAGLLETEEEETVDEDMDAENESGG